MLSLQLKETMGSAGRQRVIEQFSLGQMATQLDAVAQQLCGPAATTARVARRYGDSACRRALTVCSVIGLFLVTFSGLVGFAYQ